MKYITEANGCFMIRKTINGETRYFGTYHTLKEAQTVRDDLISNGWITLFSPRKQGRNNEYRNICKDKNGKFVIVRTHNHKKEHYGTYNTLNEALAERNLLEKFDYDYEELCSCI